jgi:hypothetical protein
MGNYQLYRTNVYLTGQMKYDLITTADDKDALLVDSFKITPISNNAKFIGIDREDILNCSHLWNIQQYYNSTVSDFYNTYESVFLSSQNLLNKKNTSQTKNYNDEYEMGCRRTYKYKNGKEFGFFCPLWIEEANNSIEFVIKLYADVKQTKVISSKKLKIDLTKSTKDNNHDKFEHYIKQYFEAIGLKNELKKPMDWVININKYDETIINGVNVKFGAANEYNVGKLPYELTSMERPLIDQDDIIISRLKNNQLITKQLLNFNLCFDLKDIISDNIIHIGLKSADYWFIDVEVLIDGVKLDTRDIFSNYDFIYKQQYSPTLLCDHDIDGDRNDLYKNPSIRPYHLPLKDDIKNYNVLEYLKDYKAVDYVYKNKITQSIIHWGYAGMNDLMYNYYIGHAGYLRSLQDDNDLTWLSGAMPCGVPEITYDKYDKNLNQYWCSSFLLRNQYISSKDSLKEFFRKPYLYKHMFSKFNGDCCVKNIYYRSALCDKDTNLYVSMIIDDANINNISTLLGRTSYTKCIDVDSITISEKDYSFEKENIFKYIEVYDRNSDTKDYYIIIFIDPKYIQYVLPLSNFIKTLENFSSYYIDVIMKGNKSHFSNTYKTVRICDVLIDILKHYDFTKLNTSSIPISIYPYKHIGPSTNTDEIKYNKTKKSFIIKRYFGKLRPYFISENDLNKNQLYKKRYSDSVDDNYHVYNIQGFKPNYPSVDYYNLIKDTQYYDPNKMNDFDHKKYFEYNSFHYNKIYNLTAEIYDKVSIADDESIHDYILNYMKKYYSKMNNAYINKIFVLYDYECDFIKKDDNNNKVYNIKIKLK